MPNKLARVRVVNNVGPPDLLRRFAARLPAATHVSAYGLTEAGGVVAFHALTDTPEQRAETCGHPFDCVEMRVVDPETLDAAARGNAWRTADPRADAVQRLLQGRSRRRAPRSRAMAGCAPATWAR